MLGLVVCLACSPSTAHAVEEGEQAAPAQVVDNSGVESKLNDIYYQIDELNSYIVNRDLQDKAEEDSVADEPDTNSPELEKLTEINSNLDLLVEQGLGETIAESKALGAARSYSFVAYANVSPTSSYAEYARGLLPHVGYLDHYVLMQDSQSSYVFAWGDFALADDGTLYASDAQFVRWYYANNSLGYQQESGSGAISCTKNSHVVISDVGLNPLLVSDEYTRRDVMLYALVAASVYSLNRVWSFLLRMRSGVVAE